MKRYKVHILRALDPYRPAWHEDSGRLADDVVVVEARSQEEAARLATEEETEELVEAILDLREDVSFSVAATEVEIVEAPG